MILEAKGPLWGVIGGDEETLLSMVRLCEMGVLPNEAFGYE